MNLADRFWPKVDASGLMRCECDACDADLTIGSYEEMTEDWLEPGPWSDWNHS